MRKSMTSFALIALVVLTACNTVRGAGRDVESVGQAVEKTAD